MTYPAMILDASLLVIVSLAMLFMVAENEFFRPLLPRLFGLGAAWFSFSQAMWLMGVWTPGASGFPLPRIGFDAMVALLTLLLVVSTVRSRIRPGHPAQRPTRPSAAGR